MEESLTGFRDIMLRIDPSDSVPIWKQIEEGVERLIATGILGPNDAVSSVRELARELRVNPLTVSKAYRRLADTGVLVVRRGEGTFVAPQPPTMGDAERHERLLTSARRFVALTKTLNGGRDASVTALHEAWDEIDGPRRQARRGETLPRDTEGEEKPHHE